MRDGSRMTGKLTFFDRNIEVLKALAAAFGGETGGGEGRDDIRYHFGDFSDLSGDSIVSPANSFGFMNGGIDAAYEKSWPGVQLSTQEVIIADYLGEFLVGQAFRVRLPAGSRVGGVIVYATPYLLPTIASCTVQVYLAARAAFRVWAAYGGSLLVPGLGTWSMGLDPFIAAWQVRRAYLAVRDGEALPASLQDAAASQNPRVKLLTQHGPHAPGSVHAVASVVPHGGYSDAARQYVLHDGTHVCSDAAELVA